MGVLGARSIAASARSPAVALVSFPAARFAPDIYADYDTPFSVPSARPRTRRANSPLLAPFSLAATRSREADSLNLNPDTRVVHRRIEWADIPQQRERNEQAARCGSLADTCACGSEREIG